MFPLWGKKLLSSPTSVPVPTVPMFPPSRPCPHVGEGRKGGKALGKENGGKRGKGKGKKGDLNFLSPIMLSELLLELILAL